MGWFGGMTGTIVGQANSANALVRFDNGMEKSFPVSRLQVVLSQLSHEEQAAVVAAEVTQAAIRTAEDAANRQRQLQAQKEAAQKKVKEEEAKLAEQRRIEGIFRAREEKARWNF